MTANSTMPLKRQRPFLNYVTITKNAPSTHLGTLLLTVIVFLSLATVVSGDDECHEPLLSQARLTASSEYGGRSRGAEAAHLDSPSAWTAGQSDFSQYLIIDLGKKFNITSISSQGRAYASEYVMEYRIDYGYDGQDFAPYRDRNGNIKIFEANVDDKSTVENKFDAPLIAQYIRINPTRWHNRISMRVQVSGCPYTAEVLAFDGQSMILLNLRKRPVDTYEDHVQFRFRTPYADASLLYANGDEGDIMALQLVNNKLIYSINLGGKGKTQNISAGSLLDDNTWHDVSIDRYGRNVVMSVDRVVVKQQLDGEFSRLNINLDLWIGGLPTLLYNEVDVRTNFTGCIENLMFNSTNVGAELKEDPNGYLYTTFGYIYHYCLHQPTQSITFMTNESYFRVEGYQLQMINCSLDFRTFIDSGVLLYSKFSLGGSMTLSLRDGKFVTTIQGDQGLLVDIEPSEKELNDGSWHSVQVLAKENLIILTVDADVSVTKRRFRFESGREYYLGGVPDNRPGLIGCMRYVHIEGRYVSIGSLQPERMHRNQPNDIIVDACQMIDRCHPNPCEHGGLCKQNHQEFNCDCSKTGYLGAVCHVSKHPHSCEAYRIDFPREKEKEIYVDVDGSGPLEPFLVYCKFIPKGPTQTILHHRSENEIVVQGYEGRGSYIRSIDYYAPLESIRIITERSSSCNQFIKYSCLNARLFSSGMTRDMFDPYSWWVGSNNQKMDYWGGSLPGTGMCACGLDGSCKDPTKGCNCDAILPYNTNELADEGLLTQKEYLPVREVHIGDTGTSLSSNKRAKINLGPLVCEGDALFSEAITFKYDDASISVSNVLMGGASDIYLQFKTTISSGVFLHGKGLHEDIKLSMLNDKTIQFSFSNGRDTQPLTIDAPYRLNDNNWHSISVERNKKEAKLVVDGQISSNVASRHTAGRSSSTTIHLFVGATEDFKEGYVGCMRSLLINGKAIDIYKPAQQGQYGLILGCHGKCESNPCLNKGICQEGYSTFTCDCQWTAYKGPICADEIGANLRSDNYVRYDFDTSLSTVEENIRVGFTTTEHKGLVIGITSHTGEYLNLLMSTSGHLKLEFDFGFERKEEVINQENFALGQHHDILIKRASEGSKLIIAVDDYEPKVYQYKISKEADAKFDQLKSIYIGRNETMDSGDGFVGCISHVSFDDHFPLRFLFQEGRKTNVHAFPPDDSIREDTCGIEPIRPPPEVRETRPSAPIREPPVKAVEVVYHGLKLALPFIMLIAAFVSLILYARWKSAEKGDYMTHEDIGAKEALDPDSAVMMGVTGPMISKGQEYYV
uniref:Neurexin-4 n=2 Tax=Aceria tosichella TaxID=561515 RepID=A0A6G1SLQ2_9ACAR